MKINYYRPFSTLNVNIKQNKKPVFICDKYKLNINYKTKLIFKS